MAEVVSSDSFVNELLAENGAVTDEQTPDERPEPRPLTEADTKRVAVVAQLSDFLSRPINDLTIQTMRETSGKSILLEFADGSSLLVQVSALSPEVVADLIELEREASEDSVE